MNLQIIFSLFLLYSIIGWILEVIATFIGKKKLINRGFLIGPYCPIYGVGSLLIVLSLNVFYNMPIIVFFSSMILCSFLEYFTSYFMERIFKARWWDYSYRKYHINGRICIENALAFGILGLFLIYIVNPYLIKVIDSENLIFSIISVIFIFDLLVSIKIIFKFRNLTLQLAMDSTEEISKKVKATLKNNVLTNRLIEAFPSLRTNIVSRLKKLGLTFNSSNNIDDFEKLKKLNNNMDKEYYNIVKEILKNKEFKKRINYKHHDKRSVYVHSLDVSIKSYKIAKKLKLDYKSTAIGALLHDFYYEDWTINNKKKKIKELHGFKHASEALKNSQKHFETLMNPIVKDIIIKHMFPLNIKPPKYIESYIVSIVDKGSSFEIFKNPKKLHRYIGIKKTEKN